MDSRVKMVRSESIDVSSTLNQPALLFSICFWLLLSLFEFSGALRNVLVNNLYNPPVCLEMTPWFIRLVPP